MADCFYAYSGLPGNNIDEVVVNCVQITAPLCYVAPGFLVLALFVRLLSSLFSRNLVRNTRRRVAERQTRTTPSGVVAEDEIIPLVVPTTTCRNNSTVSHTTNITGVCSSHSVYKVFDFVTLLLALASSAILAFEIYEVVQLKSATPAGVWMYEFLCPVVQFVISVIVLLAVFDTRLTMRRRHNLHSTARPLMLTRPILFIYFLISAICQFLILTNSILLFQTGNKFAPVQQASLLLLISSTMLIIKCVLFGFTVLLAVVYALLPQSISKREQQVGGNPLLTASPLSLITFAWLTPLMYRGWKNSNVALKPDDLWQLEHSYSCDALYEQQFKPAWERELGRCRRDGAFKRQPSLVRTLVGLVAARYLFGVTLVLCGITFKFATPMLLKALLASLESDGSTVDKSVVLRQRIILAVLLFLSGCMQSISELHVQWTFNRIGYGWQKTIIMAIYEKALKLGNDATKSPQTGDKKTENKTIGQLINFISVDAMKFQQFGVNCYFIFNIPITVGLCIFLIWRELGVAALAGVAVLCVFIPLNAFISTRQRKFFSAQLKIKDERLRQMSEIISGIRLLKLYAWEAAFVGRLLKLRQLELRHLLSASLIQALSSMLWATLSFFVLLATFAAYVLASPNENILTPQKTFVALALFNLLRDPITMLSQMVQFVVQFRVSLQRITSLLTSDEKRVYFQPANEGDDLAAVEIVNGSFAWESHAAVAAYTDDKAHKAKTVLHNINLRIQPGTLTAIVGQVGAGKSSLLSAILGQMDEIGHKSDKDSEMSFVRVRGDSALVPQQAWIQNTTLRNNITFMRPYDAEKYQQVLYACALQKDVDMLPAGDLTEIGEKGINLSGGQRQRVSLARAAYSEAKVILFDDPLSAVDEHVSRHIFTHLLSSKSGLLRDTTRIMATHNIHLLPLVDNIIVMQNGAISDVGTYNELLAAKGAFAEFLSARVAASSSRPSSVETEADNADSLAVVQPDAANPVGATTESSSAVVTKIEETDKKSNNKSARLIKDEESLVGRVSFAVYWQYAKYLTMPFTSATFLFALAHCALAIVSQIWLAIWSSDSSSLTPEAASNKNIYRLGVYAALGTADALVILLQTTTFVFGAQVASRSVHEIVLDRVIHAPTSFFDTTPAGRILNRFSRDIDSMDTQIPDILRDWIAVFLNIGTMLFLLVYGSSPWFLFAVIPLGALYVMVQRFAVSTTTQIKRMESVLRSPMISHFTESLQGLPVISAWHAEKEFVRRFSRLNDESSRMLYWFIASNRWVNITMQFVGSLIILSASLFSVFAIETANEDASSAITSSSAVGLVISNALAITGALAFLVRIMSFLENSIVSVERLREYTNVAQEADREPPTTEAARELAKSSRVVEHRVAAIAEEWPSDGRIEFADYSAKYRPEMQQPVLRNISLTIADGEKLGIVGRTGAGKSSMSLALFRMLDDVVSGQIVVSGRDIQTLNLFELRSHLSIIPQDPTVFSGTLRFNIDPWQSKSDDEIWWALRHAHLHGLVSSLAAGLEFEVGRDGQNLSVGQRQLVCLARALLRKTKILVLDEATAAVDVETDEFIQQSIRNEFRSATVLTIAHRINTVVDYDRVLVLDAGEVLEIDNPRELMGNVQSKFRALAMESNPSSTATTKKKLL